MIQCSKCHVLTDLDHGHDDELEGAGGADHDAEGDEDAGAGEVGAYQRHHVDVYPGPAGVAQLVVHQLRR